MEIFNNFSNNLKYLRETYNLKQEDIAKKVGVSRTSISYYESGKMEPTLQILISLSNLFNISMDDLASSELRSEIVKDPKLEILKSKCSKNKFTKYNLLESLYKKREYLIKQRKELEFFLNKELPQQLKEIDGVISTIENTNKDVSCTSETTIDYILVPEFSYGGTPDLINSNQIDTHRIPCVDPLSKDKQYYIISANGDSMDKIFKDGEKILIEHTSNCENGNIAIININSNAGTLKRFYDDGENIILIPESTNSKHKIQLYNKNDTHYRIKGIFIDTLANIEKELDFK